MQSDALYCDACGKKHEDGSFHGLVLAGSDARVDFCSTDCAVRFHEKADRFNDGDRRFLAEKILAGRGIKYDCFVV